MNTKRNIDRLGVVYRKIQQKEQAAYNVIDLCNDTMGGNVSDMISLRDMKYVCKTFFSLIIKEIKRTLNNIQFHTQVEFNSGEYDDEVDVKIYTFDGFEYGNNPMEFGADYWRKNSNKSTTRRITIVIDGDTSIRFSMIREDIEYSNFRAYYHHENCKARIKQERYMQSIEVHFDNNICFYTCEDLKDNKYNDSWDMILKEDNSSIWE